ncbi:hypothetical protein ACOMHN_001115 [Nucella lapillus]
MMVKWPRLVGSGVRCRARVPFIASSTPAVSHPSSPGRLSHRPPGMDAPRTVDGRDVTSQVTCMVPLLDGWMMSLISLLLWASRFFVRQDRYLLTRKIRKQESIVHLPSSL